MACAPRWPDTKLGLIDNWLRHVQDVRQKHAVELDRLAGRTRARIGSCELNVLEQAVNVCETTIVQDAWERGQALTVHAWIYRLDDGLLRDLDFDVDSNREMLRKTSARYDRTMLVLAVHCSASVFAGSTDAARRAGM